jgi:tape measure domain-containing protein
MPVSEELKIVIRAEAQNAIQNLNRVQGASKKAEKSFMGISKSLLGKVGVVAGLTFAATALIKWGKASIQFNAKMQQTTVAFETMLGSAERAADVLEELTEFSAATPFQLEDLTNGAQRLLAFGTAAEDVRDVLQDLGNAAQGQSDKLNRLVDAYGKLQAKGRASLEELNMFTEAGVPIMGALQRQLELTKEELFDYVTKGKIGFEDVNEALQSITRGEGQFAGMLEKQSQTLSGSMSTLKDNIKLLGGEIFNSFTPILTGAAKGMTRFVQVIRNLIDDGDEGKDVLETYADAVEGIAKNATIIKNSRLEELGELSRNRDFPGPNPRLQELGAMSRAAKEAARLAREQADAWERVKKVGIPPVMAMFSSRAYIASGKNSLSLTRKLVGTYKEMPDLLQKVHGSFMELTEGVSWAEQKFVKLDDTILNFSATTETVADNVIMLASDLENVLGAVENLGRSFAGGAGQTVLDAFETLGATGEINWDDVFNDIASSLLKNMSTLLLGAGLITMFIFPPLGIALLALAGVTAWGAGRLQRDKASDFEGTKSEWEDWQLWKEAQENPKLQPMTINVFGDVNDADRFEEKVNNVINHRYATA